MRQLLGKNKLFRWLPEHQQEFSEVKNILSNNLLTKHFDPNKEVTLLTGASRQHGMGFALCQQHNGTQAIIKCGSKSFTPTQQWYATIELECLAILWAIQKCEFFLKGIHRRHGSLPLGGQLQQKPSGPHQPKTPQTTGESIRLLLQGDLRPR